MAADPLPRQLADLTRLLAEMATATAGAIQRATPRCSSAVSAWPTG
jgi:hypothetical protein